MVGAFSDLVHLAQCTVTAAVSLQSMRSQWRTKIGPFNKALYFNCVRGNRIIFVEVLAFFCCNQLLEPVTRILEANYESSTTSQEIPAPLPTIAYKAGSIFLAALAALCLLWVVIH